ncbi:MAG: hypothetical protein EXR50_04725 [Dehalococcoidia bacterium]|nr:hypothetical protein [Dehalococcoidia bacterium]
MPVEFKFLVRAVALIVITGFLLPLAFDNPLFKPVFEPETAYAAAITITTNTNWSAITTGTGAGGQPGSADTIVVKNAATLTVDVTNGAAASINLAGASPNAGNGTLAFSASTSAVTVSGTLTLGDTANTPDAIGTINMTNGGILTAAGFAKVGTSTQVLTPGIGTIILTGTNTLLADFTTYNNLTVNGSGATTTLGANTTLNGNLAVTAGTLTTGVTTFTLSVTGTSSVSGTLTLASTAGTETFTGAVTVNSLGVWNNLGNRTVTFKGGLTHNGTTFTAGSGVQTFDTNSQSLGGSSAISIPSVTVTTVTLTNTGTWTVTTALAGTGAVKNNSTLNIGFTGSVGIATLDGSTTPGNTVVYNFAGTQTVKPVSYQHLRLSTSGSKTMTSVTTIAGDMTINGSSTMTGNSGFAVTGTFNYTSSGSTTLAASTAISIGKLNLTAGTLVDNGNTITVTGTGASTWTQTGTFTTTGTAIFTGAAPAIGAATFNNLTINGSGATATLGGITTVNAALTVTAGNLMVGAFALTINGATSVTDTLTITSSTGVKTFTGSVTINSGGTWNNSGSSAVTLRGGLTHSGTTFTPGTGVYTFDTTASQAIAGTLSIPSLTVTSPAVLTNNGTLTVGTALAGTGSLTNGGSGNLTIGGTSGITTLTASASGNTVTYTAPQRARPSNLLPTTT